MVGYRVLLLFSTAAIIGACTFSPGPRSIPGGAATGGTGGSKGAGRPTIVGADAGTGVCGSAACAALGKNCGPVIDACGDVVQCGTCTAPECCGCGTEPSVCHGPSGTGVGPATGGPCLAGTCASLGKNCGPVADGCGNLIQCGTCTAPQCCGCGGVPSVCGGRGSNHGADGGAPVSVASTCIAGSKGCLCDSRGACAAGLTCQPQTAPKPSLCCSGADCSASTTTVGQSCAAVTGAASCAPGVTVPAAAGSLDNCGYPIASFNESSIMCGIVAQGGGAQPAQIQAYYSDEHALTLGCATTSFPVSPLSSSPGAVYYPQLGDLACNDPVGRPVRPSLFITDITADPNCTAGDQQNGGPAYDPVAVFGTWKNFGVAADPATNNWTLGSGSDPVPTSITSSSRQCSLGFGSEVRYEAGLISGHSYRLQVMFHDGDRAADAGEACAVFCAGTGACVPLTCDNEVCGPQPDGCGGMITCPPCCTPTACAANACGRQPDGCGGLIDCPPCCTPQTCGGTTCGQRPDGCGGLLTCGPPCGVPTIP